jgi:hypothetical protein
VHKTVEVFDLNTGERIHSITALRPPTRSSCVPRIIL